MKTPPSNLRLFYIQRKPPTGLPGLQTYFPSLEVLFPSIAEMSEGSPSLASTEMVTDVSGEVATVENVLTKAKRETPIWIRPMHLVEPVEVMSGSYVLADDGSLPTFRSAWQRTLRKLNDPYNEAYTDAVFACMASRLVETGVSPHWCRFYGTFNGRVPEYRYNITDDMPDIEGEDWFAKGLTTGAFEFLAVDPYDETITAPVTKPFENNKKKLDDVFENQTLTDSESSDGDENDEDEEEGESEGELEEADIEVSGSADVHRPRLRLTRVSGSNGSSGSSHSSDYSEDDIQYRAVLKNFPAQLTVLERCDGTLDDLMEDEIEDDVSADMQETKEARWTAWVFQVIAALTTAQQLYDFVHNDLHTNNVMWTGTGETHLYYHVQGSVGGDRFYRVPTYGRIMKIIDFGRATFRPPMTSKGLWMPDAFAPHADAGGQYNCGAYFEQGKPKVQPNKSFDLTRMAVAMLETLWPRATHQPAPIEPRRTLTKESGHTQPETVSPLWNLLWIWLTDKAGRNILRNPDGSERYPNFDLYCAIARDAENAVPGQQLTLPLFDSAFRCRRKDIPADATIWKLQASNKV
jgi:hypothetical protein